MKLFKHFIAILASVGFFAYAAPASADLLYSGGEDIDFTCASGGTCVPDTNSSHFRSQWARVTLATTGGSGDPSANRFSTSVFTGSSTVWVHGWLCLTNTDGNCLEQSSQGNWQFVRAIDDAGNAPLIVRGTGTPSDLKISSRTAGGTFTDLVTCPAALPNRLFQLDLFVNYGTSGEVALYRDGVRVCDYTGDVTNGDGSSHLQQVDLSGVTGRFAEWSEVIVATTDTRGMSRLSAFTNGNGATTGFSGTNVCTSIWAATSANDASFAFSGSSNVTHECTVRGTLPPGSYNVLGLVMSARALVGTTGPQHFDFVTRVNGSDYLSSDFAPLPTFGNFINYVQTTNPDTGSAWNPADFTAAGFNVGEKTKP